MRTSYFCVSSVAARAIIIKLLYILLREYKCNFKYLLDDIRMASRRNLEDFLEQMNIILCTSSMMSERPAENIRTGTHFSYM